MRASNSYGKFRARKIGKLMRALDTLGTKSGNFQQSANKLEETP